MIGGPEAEQEEAEYMGEFVTWVATAIVAFFATNIDDIFLLTLYFSQVNRTFRREHVILGQYLGFGAIILISTLGYFGTFFISEQWIGLLGFAPIFMGVRRLIRKEPTVSDPTREVDPVVHVVGRPTNSLLSELLNPHTYGVAAVTFANGGDNISIYIPLFANGSLVRMAVMIAVFLVMIGVWCYAGLTLAHHPTIASFIERYGHIVVPFVLIGLGVWILLESNTLALLSR